MLSRELKLHINHTLSGKIHTGVSTLSFSPVGGGSINEAYQVTVNNSHRFFIKLNSAQKFPSLFEKEKNGLMAIAQKKVIKTPAVLDYSIIDNNQILILQWIEQGPGSPSFWKTFGEQLASLHQITDDHFGFSEDNYMGALAQRNTWEPNWIEFFINHRLRPQAARALENGQLNAKLIDQFEILYRKLDNIFDKENASLLHGDLWSGNFMCDENAKPVLIDPAVYFGHRSMDLAMTTLFGGFDKSFYEAYHHHFPLPDNYREQWDVCNLYPLLIHLNLFGSSYLPGISVTLKKFTA
jgi:fructosamine-3-kinase